MLTDDERTRYARHLVLPEFGEQGQEALKAASMVIVGAGGLGSPAALYLAAAGVGRIGLVDFDEVDITNLQRQILYGTKDVGSSKLKAARARLSDLNPHVRVETHDAALSSGNALEILGSYDVILDGTDNFPTRYLVNDASVLLGIPNAYGSIYRFDGQISVFGAKGGPCYRCLYPEPPPPHLVPSCAVGGVLGVLPGVVGTMQAIEAIKLVTGIGETLAGRLLLFDALRMEMRTLKLQKNPRCAVCGESPTITALIDYEEFCNPAQPHDVTASQLGTMKDVILVDVRESYEWDRGAIPGARHLPLGELSARLEELPRDGEIVLYCQTGIRSARALTILQEAGFRRAGHLSGGYAKWSQER